MVWVDCLIHLHCVWMRLWTLSLPFETVLFCVSHWEHQWSSGYASQLPAKFYDMQSRPNAVASLRCQVNQQNCYIARFIVRHEGKLSSLGLSEVPSYLEGHHIKVEGHIEILCILGILCLSIFKLLPVPLNDGTKNNSWAMVAATHTVWWNIFKTKSASDRVWSDKAVAE